MRARRIAFVATIVLLAGLLVFAASNPVAATKRRDGLVARLQNADGANVGVVRLTSRDGGKLIVTSRAHGLPAGFHGFHVHATGVCDPQSRDPAGKVVPFLSAGGHYNPESTSHGEHAGDMPPLLVNGDGTAASRFETDRFTSEDLLDGDGSAVIVHAAPDNLAHVPQRYHSHTEDVLGPDAATKATGDAGERIACGRVERIR